MTNEELLKSIKKITVKEKCPEIYQSYFAGKFPFTERTLSKIKALTDEISGAIDAFSDDSVKVFLESEAPKKYVNCIRKSFEDGYAQRAIKFFIVFIQDLKETNSAFNEIQKLFEELSFRFGLLASEMRERQELALAMTEREAILFPKRFQ